MSNHTNELHEYLVALSSESDPHESRMLMRAASIVFAAGEFVSAVDTDAQIEAVSKAALNEWVDLADAVLTARSSFERTAE